MKISGAALTFLLLLAIPPLIGRQIPGPGCCVVHAKDPISKSEVEDYALSWPVCLRSVEFYLKKGGLACTNPDDQWVQDLMKYLDSLEMTCS